MIDSFTQTVANTFSELNIGSLSVPQAQQAAYDILDSGDFQGKIPELKQSVSKLTSTSDIATLMWNTALSGETKKKFIKK